MNTASNTKISQEIQGMTVTEEQADAIVAFLRGKAKVTLYKGRPEKVVHEALPCLCGCGAMAKPKSKFIPGHDSRVKGYLGKAKRFKLANEEARKKLSTVKLPQVLVDRANADADLVVANYSAAEILELAEIAGVE